MRFDAASGRFFSFRAQRERRSDHRLRQSRCFKDLKIYSKEQTSRSRWFEKMYERVVSAFARSQESAAEEVATKADVLGRIDNPQGEHGGRLVKLVQTRSSRRSCRVRSRRFRAPVAPLEVTEAVRLPSKNRARVHLSRDPGGARFSISRPSTP